MYNKKALKFTAVGFYILAFIFAPIGIGRLMIPFYSIVQQWCMGFIGMLCIGVFIAVFIAGLSAVLSWCKR